MDDGNQCAASTTKHHPDNMNITSDSNTCGIGENPDVDDEESAEDFQAERLRKRRRERKIKRQQRKALDARLKEELDEAKRQAEIRKTELEGLQVDQKFETLSFEFRVDSSCKTEHPSVRGFALEPVKASWDPESLSPIFYGLESVYEPDNIYLTCPVRVFGLGVQELESDAIQSLFQRAVCAILGVHIPAYGIRMENIRNELERPDAARRMSHKLKRRLNKCIKREKGVQLNPQLVKANHSIVLGHHLNNIQRGMVSFDLIVDFYTAPALYSTAHLPLPSNYIPRYANIAHIRAEDILTDPSCNPLVDLSFGIREYDTKLMKRMGKRLGVAVTQGEFAHALAILAKVKNSKPDEFKANCSTTTDLINESSNNSTIPARRKSASNDEENGYRNEVDSNLPDLNSIFVAKKEDIIGTSKNQDTLKKQSAKLNGPSVELIRKHKLLWTVDEGCLVLYLAVLSSGSREWISRDKLFELQGGSSALKTYDIANVLEYEQEGIELEIQEELATFRSELGFSSSRQLEPSSAVIQSETPSGCSQTNHEVHTSSEYTYDISVSLSRVPEVIERTKPDKVEVPNDTPRGRRSKALDLQFKLGGVLRQEQVMKETQYSEITALNHSSLRCHPCFWKRKWNRPCRSKQHDVTKVSPIFWGSHDFLLLPDPCHQEEHVLSSHPSRARLITVSHNYLCSRGLEHLNGSWNVRNELLKGILTSSSDACQDLGNVESNMDCETAETDSEYIPLYAGSDGCNSEPFSTCSDAEKQELIIKQTSEQRSNESELEKANHVEECEELASIPNKSFNHFHPVFEGYESFTVHYRRPEIERNFEEEIEEAKSNRNEILVEQCEREMEIEVEKHAHRWHPAAFEYCVAAPRDGNFPGVYNPVMFGYDCEPQEQPLIKAAELVHPSCMGYRLAQKDYSVLSTFSAATVSPMFFGYDLCVGPRHDGVSDAEKRKRKAIETSLTADNAFAEPIAPKSICFVCFGDRYQCPRCWSRSELDGETSIDPKGVVDSWLVQNNVAGVRKKQQERRQGRRSKDALGPTSLARVDERRKGEAIAQAERLLKAKLHSLLASPAAIAKYRSSVGRFCHVYVKKLPLGEVVDFIVETNRPIRYLYFMYRSVAPKELSYQRSMYFLLPCETGLFLLDPTIEQEDEYSLANTMGNCTLEDFGVTAKNTSLCLFQVQSLEHPRAGDIVVKYLTQHLSFASDVSKDIAIDDKTSYAPRIGSHNPNNLMLRKRGVNASKVAAGTLTMDELQPGAMKAEAMVKLMSVKLREVTRTLTDRVTNVTEVDDIQLRLLRVVKEISRTQNEARMDELLRAAKLRQEETQQKIKDRIKERSNTNAKQATSRSATNKSLKVSNEKKRKANSRTNPVDSLSTISTLNSEQRDGASKVSTLPQLRLDQISAADCDDGSTSESDVGH